MRYLSVQAPNDQVLGLCVTFVYSYMKYRLWASISRLRTWALRPAVGATVKSRLNKGPLRAADTGVLQVVKCGP